MVNDSALLHHLIMNFGSEVQTTTATYLDLLNSGALVRLATTDSFFCIPIGLIRLPGSCEAYNSSVILTFKFETFKRATQQKAVTSRWLKYK